ncbi:hypothetical protein ANTQUA_LOCUS9936 [Anthophora quadrimaculata]
MDGEKSTNFSRFSSLHFAVVDDGLSQRVVLRYFPLNGNPSILNRATTAEAASIFPTDRHRKLRQPCNPALLQ